MDLSTYKSRMLDELGDPTGSRFTPAILEQSLRQALNEYSVAVPLFLSTTHVVTVAGRDQVVSAVTSFQNILSLVYPYVSTVDLELQLSTAFYATDNGTCLALYIGGESTPAVGEVIYFVYTTGHTIDDLDSAASTTVNPTHEITIVDGASALAALYRANSIVESYGKREADYDNLRAYGQKQHTKYLDELQRLSVSPARARALPSAGWEL